MSKRGPKPFYQKNDEIPSMPSRQTEEKPAGLARWEYQRLENELSDLTHRMMDVLETLKVSKPSEYSRLALILENALEELRIHLHQDAIAEFPEVAARKETQRAVPTVHALVNKHVPVDPDTITWEELCRLEPNLVELWEEVTGVKDSGRRKSFCAHDYFDKHIVETLMDLLGPWNEREIAVLNDMKSLNLAKDTLFAALPPCRNCEQHSSKPETPNK